MTKTYNQNSFFEISLVALIWTVILFQRIAVKVSDYQFSVGLIILYLFMAVWVVRKEIFINRKKMLFFLVVAGGILLSALVASSYAGSFSVPSLLLLLGVYVLTIFEFGAGQQLAALKGFQAVMLIIAIIGIVQFLSQLVGIQFRDWLSFISQENIIYNYNYAIPISYGNSIYKSNGVFLAEPSFFSQLIALSIFFELYVFRKYIRLLILFPALLVSFSGTGLILLAVGLVPLLVKLKWNRLLVVGIISAIALSIFVNTGFAAHTINRIGEFQDPYASGYIRFISPFTSYQQFFREKGEAAVFWLGMGPGVGEDVVWSTPTYLNPLMKLLVEYGVPGLLFFLYLVYVFFSGQSFWLALTLFVTYAALSGGLLTPQITVLYFLILIFHRRPSAITNLSIVKL